MNQENEFFLNLIMELRWSLPKKEFYDMVLSNFSEEELRSYKDKLFNQVIEKLTQAGKMEEANALQEMNVAYENRKILTERKKKK